MNREVIQDNKEAFNTWLVTGKVWMTANKKKWVLLEGTVEWLTGCVYVPDNEYHLLNKAIVEGKIVQFRTRQADVSKRRWIAHTAYCSHDPSCYRILEGAALELWKLEEAQKNGEQIQFQGRDEVWEDLYIESFSGSAASYRIKPREPYFVGQWVYGGPFYRGACLEPQYAVGTVTVVDVDSGEITGWSTALLGNSVSYSMDEMTFTPIKINEHLDDEALVIGFNHGDTQNVTLGKWCKHLGTIPANKGQDFVDYDFIRPVTYITETLPSPSMGKAVDIPVGHNFSNDSMDGSYQKVQESEAKSGFIYYYKDGSTKHCSSHPSPTKHYYVSDKFGRPRF